MEFDCFSKCFFYLATHLPRYELLEPFIVEAVEEPIELSKRQVAAVASLQDKNLTKCIDYDALASLHEQITLMTGRSSADGVEPPVEAALADAEADTFPCLLVMVGSGTAWMKVCDRTC
jgi:hypothetical protein